MVRMPPSSAAESSEAGSAAGFARLVRAAIVPIMAGLRAAIQRPAALVPGAAQHEVMRCRPGTQNPAPRGPGSAAHRSGVPIARPRDGTPARCTASGTPTLWSPPRSTAEATRAASNPFRQPALVGEVGEARHLGLELQLDRAGRAVTLLADDDLGLAVHRL